MAKKAPKAKEPIRIRFKRLSNGNQSIYLDTYRNGQRDYEFLKLYLIPERTDLDRERNAQTLTAANAIKAQRIIELTNSEAGVKNLHRSKMLLFDYMDKCIKEAPKAHKGNSYSTLLKNTKHQLGLHLGAKAETLQMKDVTPDLCRDFITYLKGAKTTTGKPLSKVSVYHYTRCFNGVLKEAVTDEVISTNPMDKLKKNEMSKRPDVKKTFLTANEVATLIQTDYTKGNIKQAFLFACFTGLRISDIEALTWGNLKGSGDNMKLEITMKKTDEPLEMRLSSHAIMFLPNRGNAKQTDNVFTLPLNANLNRHLSKWAELAGIEKHMTFHTARHTFATMGYTAGTDLYTISKLLGHKSVTTTTVYAEVIDKKKDEAITTLDNSFSNLQNQ